jgi:hypothetical protein
MYQEVTFGTKDKWPYKTGDLFSMTGQENFFFFLA